MSVIRSNLLFIIPGFFYIEEYQKLLYYNDIPLGTLQLSSLLREKADVKTDIIDMRIEEEKYKGLSVEKPKIDEFKKMFLKVLESNEIQEYDNVGINCYTSFQFLQTDLIAKILKKEFPKIILIVGGYHPTAMYKDFIYKNSPYDIIIRGEADLLFLDLFNSRILKHKDNISKIKILNAEEFIDVNTLPFPDYELYLKKYPFKNRFKFDFYISRGCPYQCAFCATNYEFRSYNFENFQKNFVKLSEIVENINNKNPKIAFADQSFNRVLISEKVLDYIIQNELQDRFRFSCQSRVETITKNFELIEKFRKCHMVVGYGFETANKMFLKEMHKTHNPSKYIDQMKKILNQYKDDNETYCRLNLLVGFPGENQQTLEETVNFVITFALHSNIQISPTLFSNYPNVYVYSNMEYYEKKYGTEFIKRWWKIPSNPFKNAIPKKSSKKYSKKELIGDYRSKYQSILKVFKLNTFSELVSWKRFFNKWYREL